MDDQIPLFYISFIYTNVCLELYSFLFLIIIVWKKIETAINYTLLILHSYVW